MEGCTHAEYLVIDGKLVCARCGEPSPRVRLVNGEFVRIGDKEIRCPHCGGLVQVKALESHEDKALAGHQDKRRLAKT